MRKTKEKETSQDVYVRPPQHGKETYGIDLRPFRLTLDLLEHDLCRLCSFANFNAMDFAWQFYIICVNALARVKQRDFSKLKGEEPRISHVVQVHKPRIIKDPLSIDASLLIRDGCRIVNQSGERSIGHSHIKFNFVISESDLQRLCVYSNNMIDFSWQIFRMLANAIDQIREGKRAIKNTSVFWIKYYSRLLYELFSVLAKLPQDKQPSYFKKLLAEIGANPIYRNKKDKPEPLALTAYCIERYMYKSLIAGKSIKDWEYQSFKDLGLKLQLEECLIDEDKDLETFRTTYVRDTYIPSEYHKSALRKKSLEELEGLVILKSVDEQEETEEIVLSECAGEQEYLSIKKWLSEEKRFDLTEPYYFVFSALKLI